MQVEREFFLTQTFILFGSSMDWVRPTQLALLNLPIQMLISFRNALTDTPDVMFNQIPEHPVAQPS